MRSAIRRVSSLLAVAMIGMMLISGCGGQTTNRNESNNDSSNPETKSLLVYCSAGLKGPVEEICRVFQEKTGEKLTINYSFGGTAHLNSQILLTQKGDVYVVSDKSELTPLMEKGLVAWEKDVVYHVPVLAVPKGNPGHIKSLSDLTRPGIRVALGDADAVPIGKIANKLLEENGLLEAVEKNVVVRTPTVNELVVYLTSRQVDAAIVWEENCRSAGDKIEVISIPELGRYVKTVAVVVLGGSQEKELAQKLAQFIASPEGLEIWQKNGYKPVSQ